MTQPDASNLTPQQESAAEMLAAGQRVVEVARALRVDRATLWRWTRLAPFQEALEALRIVARRDAAAKMRRNVLVAAETLGAILEDPRARPRDRIGAARVVLSAVREPFSVEPDESERVEPIVSWREIILQTALKAVEMRGEGTPYLLARTPGAAWAESGLEAAYPGSYAHLQALADKPDELRAACDEVLACWEDAIDTEAVDEAKDEAGG